MLEETTHGAQQARVLVALYRRRTAAGQQRLQIVAADAASDRPRWCSHSTSIVKSGDRR
jgi:hypothetical protein